MLAAARRRRTPRAGGGSAGSSSCTAARSRPSAPTRRCATRSRSSPRWSDLWLLRARAALRRGRPADAPRALERVTREAAGAHARPGGPPPARRGARREAPPRPGPPAALRPLREPSPRGARALPRRAGVDRRRRPAGAGARPAAGGARRLAGVHRRGGGALLADRARCPTRTVQAALGLAGEALLELAAKVRALRRDAPRRGARPAAARGSTAPSRSGAVEARFERAVHPRRRGDAAGALADLTQYVARSVDPAHLDEARALRVILVPGAARRPGRRASPASASLEDRPADALATLGDRCEPDVQPRAAAGPRRGARVHRRPAPGGALLPRGAPRRARGAGAARAARRPRRARPLARSSTSSQPDLERAAARGVPGRRVGPRPRSLAARGRADDALGRLDRFIATRRARQPGPRRGPGACARQILRARAAAAARRAPPPPRRLAALGAAGLGLLLLWLFRGRSVAGAIRARPGALPRPRARDHRDPPRRHQAPRRACSASSSGPTRPATRSRARSRSPAAHLGGGRRHLRPAARGRPRPRRGAAPARAASRCSGRCVRDLRRAEARCRSGAHRRARSRSTAACARSTRSAWRRCSSSGPAPASTPRCLSEWIRDVEAERARRRGRLDARPRSSSQSLELDFPVERGALGTIFTNLLRNAEAAVRGHRRGRACSCASTTSATPPGRRLLSLQVGDSAAQRAAPRGLRVARERPRPGHRARPGARVARPPGGPPRGRPADEGGGRMLPGVSPPRRDRCWLVCEDGTEYTDRLQRFLGTEFRFERVTDAAALLAVAAAPRRAQPPPA